MADMIEFMCRDRMHGVKLHTMQMLSQICVSFCVCYVPPDGHPAGWNAWLLSQQDCTEAAVTSDPQPTITF